MSFAGIENLKPDAGFVQGRFTISEGPITPDYIYGHGTAHIGERTQPKANCRNCGAPPPAPMTRFDAIGASGFAEHISVRGSLSELIWPKKCEYCGTGI